MLKSLRESFQKNMVGLLAKEVPCLSLTFGASAIGIGFLNHNPPVELAMAVLIGLGVEYAYTKWRHGQAKKASTQPVKPYRFKMKYIATAVLFGLITWGAHQALLHDHHDHHDHHHPNFAPHLSQQVAHKM